MGQKELNRHLPWGLHELTGHHEPAGHRAGVGVGQTGLGGDWGVCGWAWDTEFIFCSLPVSHLYLPKYVIVIEDPQDDSTSVGDTWSWPVPSRPFLPEISIGLGNTHMPR